MTRTQEFSVVHVCLQYFLVIARAHINAYSNHMSLEFCAQARNSEIILSIGKQFPHVKAEQSET